MATTEERMQILRMIEEGKISAGEGAELLRALDKKDSTAAAEPLRGASQARWFRVRITDLSTGRNKVNVNIPMGLVNVGMKMGARFAPDMDGVDYDQLMEAIRSGKQGKVIDITDSDDRERIEIFVE
ncbi:MAG: SHOCT-like domain-containing protein [Chloroflexota bacterium]